MYFQLILLGWNWWRYNGLDLRVMYAEGGSEQGWFGTRPLNLYDGLEYPVHSLAAHRVSLRVPQRPVKNSRFLHLPET